MGCCIPLTSHYKYNDVQRSWLWSFILYILLLLYLYYILRFLLGRQLEHHRLQLLLPVGPPLPHLPCGHLLPTQVNIRLKGTVHRQLTGVESGRYQLIGILKLPGRPCSFFNFKGTPSREEHKTICSV